MPCCPQFDLHRSSGGSSATAGCWRIWKLSDFQNSSNKQITSSLQRTVLPWLLEEFKDDFFLLMTCVFLFRKLSKGTTCSGSWRVSQVLESNLTKTVKRKEINSLQHIYFWVVVIQTGRELLGIQAVFKNDKTWC